jgi:hypothetical protein
VTDKPDLGRSGADAPSGFRPTDGAAGVSTAGAASIPNAAHVLCYIDGAFAYFTNKPLHKQWGDDWDDAPYEHNAGAPYSDEPGQIVKVAWDGPFGTPDEGELNSRYSVMDINQGDVPWLRRSRWNSGPRMNIPAGATVAEFTSRIIENGGMVYFPASAGEAGTAATAKTDAVHEHATREAGDGQ